LSTPQHAEDNGQAARHQKQQHSVQHAVERGYDDQFKHDMPSSEVRAALAPADAGTNGGLRDDQTAFKKKWVQVTSR
jgi:hypothetical protein